jgi:hypothetical protein
VEWASGRVAERAWSLGSNSPDGPAAESEAGRQEQIVPFRLPSVGGGAKRGVAAGAFVAWVIASFQWVVGVTARLARARIEEGGCGLRARLEYCLRPALGQVTIGKARPLAARGREPPPPDHPKPAAGRSHAPRPAFAQLCKSPMRPRPVSSPHSSSKRHQKSYAKSTRRPWKSAGGSLNRVLMGIPSRGLRTAGTRAGARQRSRVVSTGPAARTPAGSPKATDALSLLASARGEEPRRNRVQTCRASTLVEQEARSWLVTSSD